MKRITGAVCIIMVMLFLQGCGVEQVDTGWRGVKTVWGEVDMKAGSMPEDIYFFNPISSSIIEMDVRIKRKEIKVNTYTKDVQQANITLVANYRLSPDKAHIMFKEVGRDWDTVLVAMAIEGELKKVIGQYDAVDLISHRGQATMEAQVAITASLKSRDVVFDRLEMVNIQYLPEFEKAVEHKVIATQKAVEEANRTKQVSEQAKQTIIAAEAYAKSMQIKAQALMANAKLVEYEAVLKWDGKLPQYMFGNATPFIDLRSK